VTTKKVLVVDDSLLVRQTIASALVAASYTVVEADDGVDALEKLATTPDVSLVVCDFNMPRMDGITLLGRLRDDERWKSLPFIILTTDVVPKLMKRARDLGVRAWMTKPFKPELLVAVVRKILDAQPR
jgi:two-component system, chemotaxis family, chemotaxis protein CheY